MNQIEDKSSEGHGVNEIRVLSLKTQHKWILRELKFKSMHLGNWSQKREDINCLHGNKNLKSSVTYLVIHKRLVMWYMGITYKPILVINSRQHVWQHMTRTHYNRGQRSTSFVYQKRSTCSVYQNKKVHALLSGLQF